MGRLFGTNGIRGIPGKTLTLEFLVDVSQAIGTWFKKESNLLIGHDVRLSSPSLSLVVSSGLMATGLNVADCSLVPTPALQYGVRKLGYDGGVMITASHNPPEYNGIKVIGSDGVEISREQEIEVEDIYFSKSFRLVKWDEIGKIWKDLRIVENYINGIMAKVDLDLIREKRFKVVVDCGNGAQSIAAPYLLERLGCKVISLNSNPDGSFSGRGAEPTPQNLTSLACTVREVNADLGVAYDGDGDRSIFCDERGKVHWGDRSGALLADYLLELNPKGKVVTGVSTSQIIDYIASKREAKVIRTKVGSIDVSKAMIENDAVFGFEENGGCFYSPHIPVRDGAMTTALMLEFLAKKGIKLSDALKSLPSYYQFKAKFELRDANKDKVMRFIEENVKGIKIERIDGVKVWSDEKTWILIRPSGTEPIIRMFAESDSKEKLERIVKRYKEVVKRAIKN
jgi:phosphomannomutase/phosphoglucomutase